MEFWTVKTIAGIGVLALSLNTLAYDSGSTGADGAFAPTADTVLTLPANGIFNFTDVTVPAGVTVTFARNAANTPVFILAAGDILIDGKIDVGGADSLAAVGPNPQPTDNEPGLGGPGGYHGGQGAVSYSPRVRGSNGLGPGGGKTSSTECGGSGGGYSVIGKIFNGCFGRPLGGPPYGNSELVPLTGGSGGGGGGMWNSGGFLGQGGGGGGGALLIAASGQLIVNGSIVANGGNVADQNFERGGGGGGSGGAIRLIADIIVGEGEISADGGQLGATIDPESFGGAGAPGRIRLEANELQRITPTTPLMVFSAPRAALFDGVPSLRIASVAGVVAPTNPTGIRDMVITGAVANPVVVMLTTENVPLGTTIGILAKPKYGSPFTTNSAGVTGTVLTGSAIANVTMPGGETTLQATTTFTVVASVGDALSRYAMGERVQSVSLLASVVGNVTEFTTVSGKTFRYPSDQVAVNGGPG